MPVARHPYPFWIRLVDRLHGIRDGHRGIPQLPAEAAGGGVLHMEMLVTPYMLRLHQGHRAFIARLDQASPVPSPGLGVHDEAIAAAVARVAEIRARLADWRPDPENLDDPPSGAGLYTEQNAEEIRADRRAAHRRRRNWLETERWKAERALGELEASRQAASDGLDDAARLRDARIEEHAAHVRERVLVYFDALVMRHQDGSELQWRSLDLTQITDMAPQDGRVVEGPPAVPAVEASDPTEGTEDRGETQEERT